MRYVMPGKGFWITLLVLLFPVSVPAEVTLSLGWERPVQFRVVDADSGEAVPRSLVIVETRKTYEGASGPVKTYEVFRGNSAGLVDYRASEKEPGADLRVVAPGYALLYKKLNWQDLPARQRDKEGIDVGPPPVIRIELKNLEKYGEWKRNFSTNIAPSLEEFLEVGPPYLSPEGKKLIENFLNRERDRLMGM